MKIIKYSIVAGLLVTALWPAMSQTVGNNQLPGHKLSETQALKGASVVAIANLTARGSENPGPPGVLICSHWKLGIEIGLKGDIIGEVDCEFYRATFPKSVEETMPKLGETYIVFLQTGNTRSGQSAYTIAKFVEYSREEVEKIKKMIGNPTRGE